MEWSTIDTLDPKEYQSKQDYFLVAYKPRGHGASYVTMAFLDGDCMYNMCDFDISPYSGMVYQAIDPSHWMPLPAKPLTENNQ